MVSFLHESGAAGYSNGTYVDSRGLYVDARMWRAFEDGKESYRVRGNNIDTTCHVVPCIENDGACKVGNWNYEEGCCLGSDCDEDVKCGENCPEDACVADFDSCLSPQCYTCRKDRDGNDLFVMHTLYNDIHCIDYGTALSEDTGEQYDWIIFCWEVVSGGIEDANYGDGEYFCLSARSGADKGKASSNGLPCQFIQLGECGCAPPDVYPFGLDPPTKSCQTQDDCPFLCSDVPDSDPQLLCEAFGGIRWFEGENFAGESLFHNPFDDKVFELTIYKEK